MDVRLIGPGSAGKSTIGALLAERLGLAFLDLDHYLAGRIGDIGEYIARHGITCTPDRTSTRTAR